MAKRRADSPTEGEPRTMFCSTVFPGEGVALSRDLGTAIQKLEAAFGFPAWMLIQQEHPRRNPLSLLDRPAKNAIFKRRHELAEGGKILLVIDSPGGYADNAYEIARLFQRHCGGFLAVIPRYAKSAATLLAFGADEIYFGKDAELGPLDAQIFDFEREAESSALNEVQALERLHSEALVEIDQTMYLLTGRTGKRIETLLPYVLDFIAKMQRPLLEKLDTVHYTEQARILKEAEDYAVRLLMRRYDEDEAETIARHFVYRYSGHGFIIDPEEAAAILGLSQATPEQASAIVALEDVLSDLFVEEPITVLGRMQEVEVNEDDEA